MTVTIKIINNHPVASVILDLKLYHLAYHALSPKRNLFAKFQLILLGKPINNFVARFALIFFYKNTNKFKNLAVTELTTALTAKPASRILIPRQYKEH